MIYHPDRNSSQDANKRMQDLNLAYSVLSDHEKRMEYDRSLLENSINEDFENDEAFTEELPRTRRIQKPIPRKFSQKPPAT